MSSILDNAIWYTENGISVIPVRADGSKAPLITEWRKYSNEIASREQLKEWYGDPKKIVGIGAACGPASGNLVVLDFECDGESAYTEWLKRLPDELRELAISLPTVTTPSGGKHIWIRLPEAQPGGKLARYAKGKTKIEVRGEGHQVLAPGCPAECHKSGKLYEWDRDPVFMEITQDQWLLLCAWAAECNEFSAPDQPRDYQAKGTPAGDGSPGNDFNARGTWAETGLFDAGWVWAQQTGVDRGFLTRPGKESGISASVGQVTSKERGHPYFFVWSTSTDFAAETPYSRFAVYAILKHAGDYSEAAKELARQGYGERIDQRADASAVIDLTNFTLPSGVKPFSNYIPPKITTDKDGDNRNFRWSSELAAQDTDTQWIWEGYLLRGGLTLLSAHPKAGKTTMLSHLLKALGGSVSKFLGQAVQPSRVLVITEENESIWASRRDELGLGDHIGFISQPFKARTTAPEWKSFVEGVSETVRKWQFDLVVVDTLAKMWPVREENNSGQVDEAMLPLWNIAKEGAAVLVIHHSRKSGGGEFTSVRGSSALAGFTEIIMEFRRNSDERGDRKRVLKGVGRLPGIPDENLIELRPEGYTSLGDPTDPEVRAEHKVFDWVPILMTILEDAGEEWTETTTLADLLADKRGEAPKKGDLKAYLDRRFADGEVERAGEGRKGDPYRWRLTQ